MVIMIIKLSTNMGEKDLVITVKSAYNSHPWCPEIVAVVHRCPLLRGFSIKVAIEFDLAGLRVTVVTGLTV